MTPQQSAQRKWNAKNKDKINTYNREYYKNHRDKLKEKKRLFDLANPDYPRLLRARYVAFIQWLKLLPCTDCGSTFPPICMDFDHVRGEKKYSMAMRAYLSAKTIQLEVMKCELVCSNCHRIRTASRLRDRHGS